MFFLSSKPLFAEMKPRQGILTDEFDDFIITWTISGKWCTIDKINYPKEWDALTVQLFIDPLMSKEWDPLTVKLVKDLLKLKELEQDKVTYWNFYLTYKIKNNLMTQFFVSKVAHSITLIPQCYTADAVSKIIWERAK